MLTSLRFVARSLLGLAFIVLGWDAAQEPGGRVDMAAALGVPQPELAVRVNGYAMVVAGITLALGILPRLSAAALVASLVPTTAAGHPYWMETDPQKRKGQRIHFLKNLSMLGGLLVVAWNPARGWWNQQRYTTSDQPAALADQEMTIEQIRESIRCWLMFSCWMRHVAKTESSCAYRGT